MAHSKRFLRRREIVSELYNRFGIVTSFSDSTDDLVELLELAKEEAIG